MNGDIQIGAIGTPQHELLTAMYDRFDPLGAALGLPPYSADARHQWVAGALGQTVNVGAFSRDGKLVGHCFLVVETSPSPRRSRCSCTRDFAGGASERRF